jgi:large subunit ribosomal protein L23
MVDRTLIRTPHITEKSTLLAAQNKYVFMVKPEATKNEIKKVVKALYNVMPTTVTIVNLPKKVKGFGKMRGTREARKKAIVTLKKGDTITIQ